MPDDQLLQWIKEVNEIGGPIAGLVAIIAIAWLKFGRRNTTGGTEKQMTDALNTLAGKVDHNHEKAEEHREEIKDGLASLAERVARIEGRMEGKAK